MFKSIQVWIFLEIYIGPLPPSIQAVLGIKVSSVKDQGLSCMYTQYIGGCPLIRACCNILAFHGNINPRCSIYVHIILRVAPLFEPLDYGHS